jgi:hypothetical protein
MATFKKHNPGCKGCIEDPPPCYICSADADTLAVTLAGLSNGDCVCSSLNATHILSRRIDNACYWRKGSAMVSCGGLYGLVSYSVEAAVWPGFGGRSEWIVNLRIYGGIIYYGEIAFAAWKWTSSTSDPIDCTAARTLTLVSVPTGAVCSDWGSMTCQVN